MCTLRSGSAVHGTFVLDLYWGTKVISRILEQSFAPSASPTFARDLLLGPHYFWWQIWTTRIGFMFEGKSYCFTSILSSLRSGVRKYEGSWYAPNMCTERATCFPQYVRELQMIIIDGGIVTVGNGNKYSSWWIGVDRTRVKMQPKKRTFCKKQKHRWAKRLIKR